MSGVVQVDFSKINQTLKELDSNLKDLKDYADKINSNTAPATKNIAAASLTISGTLIITMWSLVKEHQQVEEALKALRSELNQLANTAAPIFAAVILWVKDLVATFNALPESVKKFLIVGAMIYPLLVGILGGLAQLKMAIFAFNSLSGVMAGLLKGNIVILAIVAAIAILAGILYYAYTQFEGFRNLVNTVWLSIQNGLAALWAFFEPAIMAITTFFVSQWQEIVTWWNEIWPTLYQAFVNIWNGIMAFLGPIMSAIVAIFQFAWPYIQMLIESVWENIKGVISGAIGMITSLISIFAYLFTGQWENLWNAVKSFLASAWELIWNLIQLYLFGKILKFVSTILGRIAGLFSKMWSSVSSATMNFLTRIWTSITGRINSIVSSFQSMKTTISEFFSELISRAAAWGRNLLNTFIEGIKSKIASVIQTLKGVAQKIKDFLGFSSPTKKGPGSYADEWAPNLMDMFVRGVRAGIPALKNVAIQAVNQMAFLGQGQAPGNLLTSGAGAAAPVIHIEQMHVRNDQDIRLISQELWRLHQRQARSFGGRF